MENYKRVYAKIDLDAIAHNIKMVRKKVGNDVKILGVIKADAYGHGAVEVGSQIEELVDGFALAVIEEAIVLRKAGLTKPMMLLGYTDESNYKDLLEYDVAQTIYSFGMAEKLSACATKMGKTAKVHIKVDTGMGRIGFLPNEDSVAEVVKISKLPNIAIEGLFTHFSKADMAGEGPDYTKGQFKKYQLFSNALETAGVQIAIHHVANSAGIMEYPETYLDQVRSGIITYGLYPSDEVDESHLDLKPAMELKSHIVHIKEVPAGYAIGYGGTYVTKDITRIATIPVGYGDGYPRSLSNKGSVIVNGKLVPIIGRVCMDQFMVDITSVPDAKIGQDVTLMGREGDTVYSCEEISALAGSFNYEFCCDVGRRIPRVYYKDGAYYKTVDYFIC